MTWFPAFPASPRLLPLTAAILAALSASAWADDQPQAQQPAGESSTQPPSAPQAVPGLQGVAPALFSPQMPVLASTAPPPSRKRRDEKSCVQTGTADHMTGSPDRVMYFDENVELTQCNTEVTADRGVYQVVDDQIEAYRNVRLKIGRAHV